MWSVECGVCGVCGVWCVVCVVCVCGMWHVACGMWHVACGMCRICMCVLLFLCVDQSKLGLCPCISVCSSG